MIERLPYQSNNFDDTLAPGRVHQKDLAPNVWEDKKWPGRLR
jgi:hypothetical protein